MGECRSVVGFFFAVDVHLFLLLVKKNCSNSGLCLTFIFSILLQGVIGCEKTGEIMWKVKKRCGLFSLDYTKEAMLVWSCFKTQ